MERRGFLKLMVGGVAAAAAVRTYPFRVFSFPKEIVVPQVATSVLTLEAMRKLIEQMKRRLGTVTQDTIYMHPEQLAAFKQLGFVGGYEMRLVEAPPSLGCIPVTWPLAGIPLRECAYLDPKRPPVLVPNMPDDHAFLPRLFG